MKHLLSIDDLGGADGIEEVLRLTDRFVEVSAREIPKVPALRGRTGNGVRSRPCTSTSASSSTTMRARPLRIAPWVRRSATGRRSCSSTTAGTA